MGKINVLEMQERIRKNRQECFYGRRYFYTTASDGNQIIGVLKALGDTYIAGYVRDCGSRRALRAKTLWYTSHADDLQKRLDAWAVKRGLREVPHADA
jgi:hypothetical protein